MRTATARWVTWRRMLVVLALLTLGTGARSWLVSYTAWEQALRKEGFVDEMAPPRAGQRVLIFAPHPDDEMLGCGGLVQQALASGARVDVALMTNGDASEISLILGERDLLVSPGAMIELGRRRQQESLDALGRLGLPSSRIHFLSYPNDGLVELWQPTHWRYTDAYRSHYTHASFSPYARSVTPQAPYCGQQVLADVMALLQEVRPDQVYVTHDSDFHPDHWAANCFVRYALATIAARGGEWAREVGVYEYLVHFSRYPAPARASTRLRLLPPADLAGPKAHWLSLELTPEMARRKMQGIRSYRSQAPRFDRLLLDFARANESFEMATGDRMTPGVAHRWNDMGGRRRGLGGAELEDVEITILPDARLRVNLANHNRKIGKRSYLAVDVRSWDEHGSPAVVEVQLAKGGSPRAWRLSGGEVTDVSSEVSAVREGGVYSISFPALPEILRAKSFFLTCWGSYKDHTVNSGVVSSVRVDSG